MALTRSALREKGVTEKEILDFIMEEHGNTVEAAKEKAKESAETTAQRTIDTLQAKVDSLPEPSSDGVDWKQKYDDEVKAHGETKTAYEAKETLSTKRTLAKKTLLDSGVKEDILEDFMLSALDYDAIEVKDGKIGNADKFVAAQKERYGKYFGEVKTEGAQVANPPANGGGNTNWTAQLEAARKSGRMQDVIRIKTEAARENIFLT